MQAQKIQDKEYQHVSSPGFNQFQYIHMVEKQMEPCKLRWKWIPIHRTDNSIETWANSRSDINSDKGRKKCYSMLSNNAIQLHLFNH